MRQDALVDCIYIHIHYGDQLIAAGGTCHNIEAGFGNTQNFGKKFNKCFIRFVV